MRARLPLILSIASLVFMTARCGGQIEVTDGGPSDGPVDATPRDTDTRDAGLRDASRPDVGLPDGNPSDSSISDGAIHCSETITAACDADSGVPPGCPTASQAKNVAYWCAAGANFISTATCGAYDTFSVTFIDVVYVYLYDATGLVAVLVSGGTGGPYSEGCVGGPTTVMNAPEADGGGCGPRTVLASACPLDAGGDDGG
jgi:hypothetical protein